MIIPVLLQKAELKCRNCLEEYFSEIFRDVILPSHDLSHHRRVWEYAKELLYSLYKHGIGVENDIPGKLIMACYLHDSGMVVDSGIKHGYQSMLFCSRFLKNNNLNAEQFNDLLEVIENHDRKDYKTSSKAEDLFTLLSVADDMDAYGLTGVYRYAEIYLKRGVEISAIGDLVLPNVTSRFEHFSNLFKFDQDLVNKHKFRYNQIMDFFTDYKTISAVYKFDGKSPSGNCGVLEVIDRFTRSKEYSIEDIINAGLKTPDKKIQDFFMKMSSEIGLEIQPEPIDNS